MDGEFSQIEHQDGPSAQQTLQTVFRYLRLLLRHRLIVAGFFAAAICIAIVQYKRTPRRYDASASMMIRHVSTSTDLDAALATHGLLASYSQLLLSDTVVKGAVESLRKRPPELRDVSQTAWPKTLRSMLTVSFESNENIVEVSCRSMDPESTVDVIQALSTSSAKFIEEDQHSLSHHLVQRLDSERRELETRLNQRRQQLAKARKECGDISTLDGSDAAHPIVSRVNELSSQLTAMRGRRVEMQSALANVRNLATVNADLSQVLPTMEKLVGKETVLQIPGVAVSTEDTIAKIAAELHAMESGLAVLKRHYGKRHPERIRRETEIQLQRTRLAQVRLSRHSRVAAGIRDPQVAQWITNVLASELSHTIQYEALLQTEYDSAEQNALALNDELTDVQMAEREVETLQQLHTALLNRLSSIEIGNAEGSFRVAALNEPVVPTEPVSPVLPQLLAIWTIIALVLCCATIYVIDLVDDRLCTPEEVRNQLGLPVLGLVRPLPDEDSAEHHIYVHGHPLSAQTECFRTIRTSITLSGTDTRCLAITSSEPSEGKTTLTVNLAATFAQTGNRTLLIDADMRRPGLSKLLGIRGNGGLSEILQAREGVPEMCRERITCTEVERLEVLPCGPRTINAGVLLSQPALATILDWATSEYDQVLIDCPPSLPVSDAAIVGNYVEGIIFLLNPNKTHRRTVIRAVDQLRQVGMNLIGVVTNTSEQDVDSSYGYGYRYGKDYTYSHDDDQESNPTAAARSDPRSNERPYRLLSASTGGEEPPASDRKAA